MAEARSAIQVFEGRKRGVKLLVSNEGVEISFVIPHPRELRQNALRLLFRNIRAIQRGVYPASPAMAFATMVTVSAIVLAASKDSWWRNSWLSWIVWHIGNWVTPFAHYLPHSVYLAILASCTALLGLMLLMSVQRWVLRRLLSYRQWMYLDPKEQKRNLVVMLWAGALKLLSGRNPLTYSFQSSLPHLPVPTLRQTVQRYLASVHPLLSTEEFAQTQHMAQEFLSDQGPKLQRYLYFKYWWDSNYVTNWWEQYVYLKGRSSIMINSNYYVMDSASYVPTRLQTSRAAGLIAQILAFKQLLDREQLEPLLIRGIVPLCMRQYSRMFSTTRIPGRDIDTLQHYDGAASKHVAVLYDGRYYKVPIYSKGRHGRLLCAFEIQRQLDKIKQVVEDGQEDTSDDRAVDVAALTSQGRIRWAETRERYFSEGQNKVSLDMIESAVFVVVLDSGEPESWNEKGRSLLHGAGNNRWFDKSLTLVVYKNGTCGLNAEHSWADAPVVAHLWEHVLGSETIDDMYDAFGRVRMQRAAQGESDLPAVSELKFEVSMVDHPASGLAVQIQQAKADAQKSMEDLDLHVMAFTAYGKGFMKKQNVSPDAFIQMALQLAYYKDSNGQFTQTYEASMTRLYKEGRTETVRPVTDASKAFVLAIEHEEGGGGGDDDKYDDDEVTTTTTNERKNTKAKTIDALREACEVHQNLYRDAMSGKGVDRHLFTLYCVSVGMSIESAFLKSALARPWRLSTSQQPQQQTRLSDVYFEAAAKKNIPISAIYSPGGGFGPVDDDGYGVSYMITGEDQIFFHVSSKLSSTQTDSMRFCANLEAAFAQIQALFE